MLFSYMFGRLIAAGFDEMESSGAGRRVPDVAPDMQKLPNDGRSWHGGHAPWTSISGWLRNPVPVNAVFLEAHYFDDEPGFLISPRCRLYEFAVCRGKVQMVMQYRCNRAFRGIRAHETAGS